MQVKDIRSVAVIGAGMMGVEIGVEFARFGYPVSLCDTSEEKCKEAMGDAKKDLDLMAETEILTADEAKAAYGRLRPTTDLKDAVSGVDWIAEAVDDQLALKQDIFARVDEICPPPAIIATNTSGLKMTDIAAKTKHPERCILVHYYEPAHLMPYVDICKGEKTDPAVLELTLELLKKLRKKSVVMTADIGGGLGGSRFLWYMGECVRMMVDEWGFTPQMVDDIITYSFGRRTPWTGFFHRADLQGLDFWEKGAREHGMELWWPMAEAFGRGELGMKTGKGIYDWPGDSAERFRSRSERGLAWLLKQDYNDGLL